MNEWFKKAFGEDYLSLYAHRDANEAANAVDLILQYCHLAPGSLIIDAPCGAGRHIGAFRDRGMQAFGFDLSMPLLREASQHADLSGCVVRSDLRALPLKRESCHMVVNLFSSLGYFDTDETNLAVIYEIVALVQTNGWVVIDFMNSEYVRLHLQPETTREIESGMHVTDRRWIEGTPPRVNKQTHITHADGSTDILEESVRLFTRHELHVALQRCGVSIEHEFGSYRGDRFQPDSPRLIIMGRRR
jgi:hypothetical protein